MAQFDLLVIGGGINGVGIARDAVGRGLSVCLCEKDDFASHTSSWSTKLIHGGLRYLEHREFRLVRESLIEREVLLNAAPHLIQPLRFVLPHHRGMRPAWMLRLGLFIYDHIGGRKQLLPTRPVNLEIDPVGAPLSSQFKKAFEYTDCRVDDSRLVITNAIDAADRGAVMKTRTAFVSAHREADGWRATLSDEAGIKEQISAKAIVNAAGPWVNEALAKFSGVKSRKRLRLVKGSHIITKKLYDHDRAYIFQNADNRIVFAIPYVNNTTLVGTTDIGYDGDPAVAKISEEETTYLRESISEYLKQPVTNDMIVGSFSGVRPLYDDLNKADASAVTRDYAFDVEEEGGIALLSVYGGKLTTYRKLAEHALDKLRPYFPEMLSSWTANQKLPGGSVGYTDWVKWKDATRAKYAFLEDDIYERMIRAYGTRIEDVIGGVETISQMGRHLGAGLYEREVRYLVEHEFARTADDILLRRTKLGSIMSQSECNLVDMLVRDLCHNSGCAA